MYTMCVTDVEAIREKQDPEAKVRDSGELINR